MKKYRFYLLALLPLLGGCEAYLDVNPKSEVTDKELYATAEGCEDAIYGIYAEMGADKDLYGRKLSFEYPETMIGNFTIPQTDPMAYAVQRQWTTDDAVTIAEDIWVAGYKVIGHINKALTHILPKADDVYPYIRLYKGELLALRAFMHFEMVRLFAVSSGSGDSAAKAKAIPYVKSYGIEVTPYSSLDKVFEEIVGDLTEAEKYLAEDEELVTPVRTNAADGFTSCRITHLNLYAVQAMLARVYWTAGNLELAEKYAEKVIDSGKFPLMRTAEAWNAVETGTLNMQETLFGLYSTQFLKNYYDKHIYSGATLELSDEYKEVYATDEAGTDKRYTLLVQHQHGTVHQALQQNVRQRRDERHLHRQLDPGPEPDPDSRNVLHRRRGQSHQGPRQGGGIPRLRGDVARADRLRRPRRFDHRGEHLQRTPQGVLCRRREFLRHEAPPVGRGASGHGRLLRHGRRHLYDSHSEKRGGQLPKLNDEAL